MGSAFHGYLLPGEINTCLHICTQKPTPPSFHVCAEKGSWVCQSREMKQGESQRRKTAHDTRLSCRILSPCAGYTYVGWMDDVTRFVKPREEICTLLTISEADKRPNRAKSIEEQRAVCLPFQRRVHTQSVFARLISTVNSVVVRLIY